MQVLTRESGKTSLKIPFKAVAITAYAILVIPILIFFVGWLKWYLAIIFSGVLLFGAFWLIKNEYWDNDDVIEIRFLHFALIVAIFGLWVLFSGSCGFGVSNYDTTWRTAYLRDLIDFKWPIFFPENNCTLIYYFVFWMPVALFGKAFGLSAAFGFQWFWMLLIVIISYLLITYLFKDYKTSTLWTICIIFIMWSGLNLLGTVLTDTLGWNLYGIQIGTNEAYCDAFFNGESFNFFYRSNQNFIEDPYNQILIWIIVPLFLQKRKIENYAFLGLILFPFSPWGTIGIGIFMVIDAVRCIFKDSFKTFIKKAFSIQNLCAIFSILIVFGLFFSANSRTDAESGGGFGVITLSKFDLPRIIGLIIFWLCEFGIYYFLIWKKNKKDFTFRCLLPVLMLIPFFWVGNIWGRDFCMNVSLPAIFILMIYMIGYVKDEVMGKALNIKSFILVSCLLIASSTVTFDIAAKTKIMIVQKSFAVQEDWFYTFSNKSIGELYNQGVENPKETTFFKYLAKSFDETALESESLQGIKSIVDINEYFEFLKGKDCTVYVAVQETQGISLSQETVDKMRALGFDGNIDTLMDKMQYHSFVGISDKGEAVYQQIGGDEYIRYQSEIDGYPVIMESATLNTGNFSTIIIKGRDYSAKGRGLNVVVRDNATGCVIDSVAFDTHVDEIPCYRP